MMGTIVLCKLVKLTSFRRGEPNLRIVLYTDLKYIPDGIRSGISDIRKWNLVINRIAIRIGNFDKIIFKEGRFYE